MTATIEGSTQKVAKVDVRFDTNGALGSITDSGIISMQFVASAIESLECAANDFYLV